MSNFHLHNYSAADATHSTTLVKVMDESLDSEFEIEAKEDKESLPLYQEKRNHLLPTNIILTRVRCMNKNHTVAIHPDGRLMLIDHPFRRKETEDALAFKVLGGDPPKCLQLLEAWKHLQKGTRFSRYKSNTCSLHIPAEQHLIGTENTPEVDYLKFLPKDLQLALKEIRSLCRRRQIRAKIEVKARELHHHEAVLSFVQRKLKSIGISEVEIYTESYSPRATPGSNYLKAEIHLPKGWFASVNKDAVLDNHFVLRKEGTIPGYGNLLQVVTPSFVVHRALWIEGEKKLIYVTD